MRSSCPAKTNIADVRQLPLHAKMADSGQKRKAVEAPYDQDAYWDAFFKPNALNPERPPPHDFPALKRFKQDEKWPSDDRDL